MTALEAAFLGVVQGLTEFLPISSSGHLVLFRKLLGIHADGITFDVFVHFGTLLSVITAFRKDLLVLMRGVVNIILNREETRQEAPESGEAGQLVLFLLASTVPTAILGLLLRSTFESAFANPSLVSGALIVTGVILLLTNGVTEHNNKFTYMRAVVVGLSQVVAFFPGISRSGTTISTALFLGIKPLEAARYSFLLAIPLIFGVTLIKCLEMLSEPPSSAEITFLVIGGATAYVSGLWAIKLLMKIVQQRRFGRFAYYCFAVGTLGLILNH